MYTVVTVSLMTILSTSIFEELQARKLHTALPAAVPLNNSGFKGDPFELGYLEGNVPGSSDKVAACLLYPSLACEKGVSPHEAVAVCPVDPYVDTEYFSAIGRLAAEAETVSYTHLDVYKRQLYCWRIP